MKSAYTGNMSHKSGRNKTKKGRVLDYKREGSSIKYIFLDIRLNYKVIYNNKTELQQAEKCHVTILLKELILHSRTQ